MVVVTLELVPPRLRGGLTRWLSEVAPGVYVGRINTMVREHLWEAIVAEAGEVGRAVMVHPMNSEQGYHVRMHGDTKRQVVEVDGLQLIAHRHMAWRDWLEDEEEDD